MSQDVIEREILIEASRERVWAVLTEAQHVKGWFGDSADVDLRPGGTAAFGWTEHGTHRARGTDVAPAEGASTLVEFTLTEVPLGTLLRVVETGFASLHGTTAEQEKALQQNTEGWTSELAELMEYAERPAA